MPRLDYIIDQSKRENLVSGTSLPHTARQGVETIPLFPLSTLLYPGGWLELRIFEPRYLGLIDQCLEARQGFGVVRIEEGTEALREPDARQPTLSLVGTLVEILDHCAMPDGQKRISVRAGQRFEVLDTSEQADRLLMGRVRWLRDDPDEAIPPQLSRLADLLREFVAQQNQAAFDIDLDSASEVSWWLARLVVRDAALGQRILSANSPLERLRTIDEVLAMQGAD